MSNVITVTVEFDPDDLAEVEKLKYGNLVNWAPFERLIGVLRQAVDNTKPVPRCPYDKIVQLYRENCPSLKAINGNISDRRKTVIRNAWKRFSKGVSEEDALERFKWFFRRAERSDFLSGRLQQSGAYLGWKANLDFLLRPAQIDKIIDGGHDDE